MESIFDANWFGELRQNGMLISPVVREEIFPDECLSYDEYKNQKLRDAWNSFQSKREEWSNNLNWISFVLEDYIGMDSELWEKHNDVSDRFKLGSSRRGSTFLKADRVLYSSARHETPKLVVMFDKTSKRIGLGRGRKVYADFIELLRRANHPLGILTNGYEFRLVYVGSDFDAWIEWDARRWFEDEIGSSQLAGFKLLCGKMGLFPRNGFDYPLLSAVLESRNRQGELSSVLGEQTRKAVELLITAVDEGIQSNTELSDSFSSIFSSDINSEDEKNQALYQAVIRIVMRFVVIFFAEARELLPMDNELYYSSYSLGGLFSQLQESISNEGVEALDSKRHAWYRILGLFNLISNGSGFPDLTIPAYGGGLFRQGSTESVDRVLNVLSIVEDPDIQISDRVVYRILHLLRMGKVKAKVGRTTRYVSGPVNFSDLRTEYIGMIYEGLLDYQLRRVRPEEEAIVFLNLGIQPALPFSLLLELDDKALKDLISRLSKEKSSSASDVDESMEEDEESDFEEEDVEQEEEDVEDEEESEEISEKEDLSNKIHEWAINAVKTCNLVKKPRGKTADLYEYEKNVAERAKKLISFVRFSGQPYLIRTSGTRKGTGTFYTKPQLAVPTVHRTLEPLVYDVEGEGEERILSPKLPHEILSLKICDPAMGSGSFLVAALRYVTDVLYESLWFHDMIKPRSQGGSVVTIPSGAKSTARVTEELLPMPPDDDGFELFMKSHLKRYVVERCIYGVDLNPLAVDLAKLSLWVETMDRELPFEFLDHKLKMGNSLVGCWFDVFQDYPLAAWLREGGDEKHDGVHYKQNAWGKSIKKINKEVIKPEIKLHILRQSSFDESQADKDRLQKLVDRTIQTFNELNEIPIFDQKRREDFYRDRIVNDPEYNELRERFDLWCSIWFWPPEIFDTVIPSPANFDEPSEELTEIYRNVARDYNFFHWELEFPDVFFRPNSGFDAVVGNPPWEVMKPKSHEFFTIYDPIYRTRGKQEALFKQKELFESSKDIEYAWILYSASFRWMSNWIKNSAFPYGDPKDEVFGGNKISIIRGKAGQQLHDTWRNKRSQRFKIRKTGHPYMYQGSADLNTYKMFTEQVHNVCREHGRFGMILPSSIYTDQGTTVLRSLFLEKCKWEWIFGFENRKKIFDIHGSFKFGPIIVEKAGETESIKTTFMHRDLSDWETPYEFIIPYSKDQVYQTSPFTKSILEINNTNDAQIIRKIYSISTIMGDPNKKDWNISYSREIDITNNSIYIPPLAWWKEKGYKPDLYGRWIPTKDNVELIHRGKKIGEIGDIGVPLYEGRMLGSFDFSEKGWVSGKGRTAIWREIPIINKKIEPQFLLSSSSFSDFSITRGLKNAYKRITSATNTRSMISSCVWDYPCEVNASLLLVNTEKINDKLLLSAVLNSFVTDFVIRIRFGSITLNWFILEETPILSLSLIRKNHQLVRYAFSLNCFHSMFSTIALSIVKDANISNQKIEALWAITPHERLRIKCNIDAIIAELYNLEYKDYAWILKDCGYEVSKINEESFSFNPKGFWRVDKDQKPEFRHTVLALKAFYDLKNIGLEEFLQLNNGEGWMIPETLTYEVKEDGTIEFDTEDGTTAEVRNKLGPRFYDWQLEGTIEESWRECIEHAKNILGQEGYEEFLKRLESGEEETKEEYKQEKGQMKLFDYKPKCNGSS